MLWGDLGSKIEVDLRQRHLPHIRAIAASAVQFDHALYALLDIPARAQSEKRARLGAIQFQVVRLMRMGQAVKPPSRTVAPDLRNMLDNPSDRPDVGIVRAEIPAVAVRNAIGI